MSTDLFPFQALRASLLPLGAVVVFPVAGAFVALAAPHLASLQYGSMPVLAANHLVTLGWGTLIAMGALHQMLPAAVGVRRDLGPLIPTQMGIHLAGMAVLVAGFLTGRPGLQTVGGGGVVIAVSVLLGMTLSIVRPRRRALPVLRYVIAALLSLGTTVVWGLVLVLNRWLAFWPAMLGVSGLGIHLALGLIGWFGTLVIGVSYYLLPRFAGIHGAAIGRPAVVFSLLVSGLVCLVAGAAVSTFLVRLGLLLCGLAGVLYVADVLRLLRLWRSPARDIARAHWWILIVETAALSAGTLTAAAGIQPGGAVRWGVAGVALFLLGWVTLAITGQAYKVTPFLMWHYRFARGLSAYDVPRLEAPYWPRAALPPFALLVAAAPLIVMGVLAASPACAQAGGLAYVVGAALFSCLMAYSWLPALWRGWRGRRPLPLAEPR